MPRAVEEVLYPALEDFSLDVVLGKGPTARSIRLDLPRFTLIAATTRPGRITLPLRERFGFSPRLDYYDAEDLVPHRVARCRHPGVVTAEEGAEEIARRSRGTPRIANRLLRRVRDVRRGAPDGAITARYRPGRAGDVRGRRARARPSRSRDPAGDHRAVLAGVRSVSRPSPRPSGRSRTPSRTWSSRTSCSSGFLQRTPRGRVATPRAYAHLGVTAPRPTSPVTAAFPQVGWGLAPVGAPRSFDPEGTSMILAQTSGGGGSPLLLLMLAMPVVLWLMMRSQKKKVAAQQAQQRGAEVGDEIMTTAGIFGTIVDEDEDEGTVIVRSLPAPGSR